MYVIQCYSYTYIISKLDIHYWYITNMCYMMLFFHCNIFFIADTNVMFAGVIKTHDHKNIPFDSLFKVRAPEVCASLVMLELLVPKLKTLILKRVDWPRQHIASSLTVGLNLLVHEWADSELQLLQRSLSLVSGARPIFWFGSGFCLCRIQHVDWGRQQMSVA